MIVTGNLLKTYFRNSSLENKKIYIEGNGDDALSEAIATYFIHDGEQFMYECINLYMEEQEGIGVTLTNFVLHLSDIKYAVNEVKQDKLRTQELMKKTKEKMEGLG